MAFKKEGVLKGLRVIDFGQYIPGPFCSMMLGDYGADVVHIDPPGGPVWDDPCNAAFMRGKRNISLNLKDPKDLAIAKKLISTADVVVENFRPGVMDGLGLGHEEMLALNPMLVYVSIPGFSSKDKKRAHLRGWEGVVDAEGGLYQVSRYATDANGNMVAVPAEFRSLYLSSVFAALAAVHACIAALIARERIGKGQWVESSMYDACYAACGILGQEPYSSVWDKDASKVRTKTMYGGPSIKFMSGYKCKDGKCCVMSPPPRGMLKMRDALIPEEYRELPDSQQPDFVKEYMAKKWLEKTAREWEIYFEGQGAGCAVTQETKDWMHDDDAIGSDSVVEMNDPILGKTAMVGSIAQIFGTPADINEPRHLPDADRDEILAELGSRKAPVPNPNADPTIKKALEGINVLDLSQVLAGPICCKILVEYGANVIKINNPRVEENVIASSGHETNNAGKKTIYVDMKAPEGKEIIEALVKKCDVFHSNFAPEVYAKLGFAEEHLRELNPEIIFSMCNLFSAGGRRENYRGHEELAEALSGISTRNSGSYEHPVSYSIMICDHSAGEEATIGILLALYNKMKGGKGQRVRASLSRTTVALQLPYAIDYEGKVWNEPRGPVKGWSIGNRLYECADKKYVFVASDLDKINLSNVPEFASIDYKASDAAEKTEAVFKTKDAAYWSARLTACGITITASRNYTSDVMEDAYAKEIGLVQRRWHPGLGERRVWGASPKMSLTPAIPGYAVPAYGTDSEAVLETIGMADDAHLAVTRKVFTK